MNEQPTIGGASVPTRGQLFRMLSGIFDNSEKDCRIEINFNHNSDGNQQNDCRDLLLAYIKSHRVEDGRAIATRLQGVTTQKSGLGLLFLILAGDGQQAKLVLSRFPADQGILAEERNDRLTVEFLEKVFMKSATAYKAAIYSGKVSDTAFWKGRAVDKQINIPGDHLANYWIRHFLASDFQTTAAAGSRRLALALRDAMHSSTDQKVKMEIAAAVTLSAGLAGRTISAQEFCQHFRFSGRTTEAIKKIVKHDNLMAESFQFDPKEFAHHIAFRSVELDNGGVLTAEASRFDDVFQHELVAQDGKRVRYITEGEIIDQRLRKGRP